MATKADWDTKYQAGERSIPVPDNFLAEAYPFLPAPGMAPVADIACGGGRHALELARWGFRVHAIDYSIEALRLSSDRAAKAGLQLETHCVDLEEPGVDLGEARFDVVAVFNYLHRPLIPILKRSLRPGGVVIYKTFTRKQTQFGFGPRNPDYLLGDNELPTLFSDFRHLLYRETCEFEATAALVAQRP